MIHWKGRKMRKKFIGELCMVLELKSRERKRRAKLIFFQLLAIYAIY